MKFSKLYVEHHTGVSVLYADVVNYTYMTTQLPVKVLVETLHELFVKFDQASEVIHRKYLYQHILMISNMCRNLTF